MACRCVGSIPPGEILVFPNCCMLRGKPASAATPAIPVSAESVNELLMSKSVFTPPFSLTMVVVEVEEIVEVMV